MAYLWSASDRDPERAADDPEPRWSRRPIDATRVVGDATFARADLAGGARWLVLGPATVRVNGAPLLTGVAVLRDRDELLIDGARVYFSTEAHPVVTTPPPGDRPLHCPRCTVAIAMNAAAVACPTCGIWHHESADRQCWTHAAVCASCDQATAFDAPFRFDPAVLG
ncbi:MAG: hypothetical protein IT294_17290 [Deltaproteobacteria bacterium]|nr:hypothetical protein [Deltaproteobacteria bacterium]